MLDRDKKCPYCNSPANIKGSEEFTYDFVECPNCGRFKCQTYPNIIGTDIKDKIASYLYYTGKAEKHSDYRFYNFIGSRKSFEDEYAKYPWCNFASLSEIEAFFPKSFAERIDYILLGIAKKSQYFGDKITLTREHTISAFFINRFDKSGKSIELPSINYQLSVIIEYLKENGYVEHSGAFEEQTFIIKPNGYKRIDELQKNQSLTSKNVFVAMSFAENMKEVRETIKNAITANGYIPRIMDEIEHNHQIVPEMLYEIRQSKFVIAELTGHNNGAYFEAGYALGFGKEVIQVCNKEKFGTDGHFDVKQINTVMWETQEELFERLNARIKATIA